MLNGIEQNNFGLLDEPKSRWRLFTTSFGVQAVLLCFVLVVSMLQAPRMLSSKDFTFVNLTAPDLSVREERKPEPVRAVKLHQPIQPILEPKLIAPLMAQLPKHKAPELASAPKVVTPVPEFQQQIRPVVPKAPQVVVTNLFGSSATPTLPSNTPAAKVQTGGFGDPNGLKPDPNSRAGKLVAAAAGSFDLPTGPGNGNGSGGSKGTRGVVASAGFGSSIALQTSAAPARAQIQQTGFGDARVAPEPVRPRLLTAAVETTPVSILSKPKPQYTDEARKQKIEGEVLLDVTFTATGQVHVNGIVRGLGHGLDEAAVKAAQQIRYSPAKRDGQAVDSNARLHIVFQLT